MLLTSAAALAAPIAARAQTLIPLRVALIPAEACGQVYFAKQMGFFEKAGLSVEIQTIPNTSAIAASVAGGSTDIGFSAILSIATAYKKGIPFTIVAPGNVYDSAAPIAAIVVAQNSDQRLVRECAVGQGPSGCGRAVRGGDARIVALGQRESGQER